MHEKSPLLTAEKRERIGTRYATRDRKRGRLPAIVYGHGREPLPITLDAHSALGLITKGEKVFRLDFPGHKEADEMQMVLLKDVQFDYMGSRIVHCDFARVDLNERVHTRVHISLVGEARGLKIAGNLLMHPVTEIEIECRVMDIPDHIDVDISNLDEGSVITAGDVKLPQADMKLISDTHGVVAQIVQGVELKAAEATTVAAEGAASPEVLTAKKEDAKGAAPAAGAKGAAPAAGAKPAAGAAKPAAGAPKK
ncbi:MAG: 50S ribosomal protein L25 [Phycisphaeraceae bacterium]|nr:50S ribosomal protein L25 [Phycisphaeraceae bacterium]MBX3407965.1 50S ribosomal protein L25 [Phycisphaeraceae bacterium]